MTSARVAAMHARREQEFLDVCVEYEDRLEEAKNTYIAAAESGDEEQAAEAASVLKAASREMHEFRAWARAFGKPKEGTPGRDATIRIGGAVDGVGR
ncbi:hypothetical protein AB0J35_57760 [Nonomuraea angiospora]|uniref:hypothetical protein n=1 Tax=Nonomuraea angiospora TaxID=46172 RepID=UPI0034375FCA